MLYYATLLFRRDPPRKKVKRSLSPMNVEILKELRVSRPSETPLADEDDLFGQSIAATLKKIPPQQKALVKMRMQQFLYEVQFCPPQHPLPPAFPTQDYYKFLISCTRTSISMHIYSAKLIVYMR